MMMAGGVIWIAVMLAVLIAVVLVMASRYQAHPDRRDYFEKPKRSDSTTRSHLVLGDDGELVEIVDDHDEAPKRKRDDL